MSRWPRPARTTPIVVALVTFVAFLPVLRAGFVSWDDNKNFLTNPHYRGLGLTQLRWMWSTVLLGHYVPLSWMTLGLDYVAWGMNPAGYHLGNLLLHAANAVLIYFIARRVLTLTGAVDVNGGPLALAIPAAFAALIFAVHPLRVESVAWVTERRDVLSGFFFSLTILFYLKALDRDGARKTGPYVAAILFFVCALLSKGTSVSLPAVLLILNAYPLKRLGGAVGWWNAAARRVYLELVPFAIPAVGIMFLSVIALHPPSQLPTTGKIAVSAFSLCFYLVKTIAPINLSPLYEMPQTVDPSSGIYVASYAATIALATFAWAVRKRWPGVTAALVAFVAISLPMLGPVQNGPQIAADRYTYHAAPALAILAAGGLALAWRAWPTWLSVMGAAVIVAASSAMTWKQTFVWRDSEHLWTRVLEVDPSSATGHSGMAGILFAKNRVDEGIAHSRRAVEIAPSLAEGHNDLGIGLARIGQLPEAIEQYRTALALKPTDDEAENNWGVVMARAGQLDSAIVHYGRALTINPDYADAEVNWGNALVRQGLPDRAIDHYQKALWIQPDHADAQHNWGVALARQGKFAEAIEHFKLALAINPEHAEAKDYLARATQLLRDQNPGH